MKAMIIPPRSFPQRVGRMGLIKFVMRELNAIVRTLPETHFAIVLFINKFTPPIELGMISPITRRTYTMKAVPISPFR